MNITYGKIFSDLKSLFLDAQKKVYTSHYGTPVYFKKLTISIHKSFDDYCDSLNIDPCDRGKFRDILYKNGCAHLRSHSIFDYFFKSLPNPFNVRGVWTSLKCKP